MPACLVVQPIHESGLALLASRGVTPIAATGIDADTLVREMRQADAVIVRTEPIPPRAIEAAERLRVIAKHGVGFDNIPVPVATSRGVVVVYTPGANARSAAEQAIALMFAVAKRIPPADRAQRNSEWRFRYEPGLVELHGKTLGVIGFGTIGRFVAEIAARGLGMRVIVFSPRADDSSIVAIGATRVTTLDELLRESDVVTLHRPARPDTVRMIGASELASMKKGAILINTARGDLVDEDALAEALRTNHLLGAGVDVYAVEPPPANHPLFGLPNVVLSPHLGAATAEAMRNAAVMCAEQVLDVLEGRRPPHVVNPDVFR